jgi:hypothetical protein
MSHFAQGRGLKDPRSGLFTELVRVTRTLQEIQPEALGYIFKNVANQDDRRPEIRAGYVTIEEILGPAFIADVVQFGVRAHR